jgi:hypothetical protein
MTKDEALDLALEALVASEYYIHDLEAIVYAADDLGTDEDRAKMQEAITAIKQARSAPVHEPVRWSDYEPDGRRYPSVPDAMTSADIQEHIEYVAGWNDCRQAMMEMMK